MHFVLFEKFTEKGFRFSADLGGFLADKKYCEKISVWIILEVFFLSHV